MNRGTNGASAHEQLELAVAVSGFAEACGGRALLALDVSASVRREDLLRTIEAFSRGGFSELPWAAFDRTVLAEGQDAEDLLEDRVRLPMGNGGTEILGVLTAHLDGIRSGRPETLVVVSDGFFESRPDEAAIQDIRRAGGRILHVVLEPCGLPMPDVDAWMRA